MLNINANTSASLETIVAVTQKFMQLDEKQKQYVLGYMTAIEQMKQAEAQKAS